MRTLLAAAAFAAFATSPAAAQKAQDMLRIALNDLTPVLDAYTLGAGEASVFRSGLYETLVGLDERAGKFVPVLAKSFTRIDPVTLEFELREGVKYHNGNAFDAADVKYTLDWLTDPASKVLFKDRYSFVRQVEVLGPLKVRVHIRQPYATDLSTLAYQMPIYDADAHGKLDDKSDYGRTGIGTGPYRLLFIDRNKGMQVERFDGYSGEGRRVRAAIKRIHGVSIPDRQTRIAQMMTGGIDVMRRITPDDARELAARGMETPVTPGGILMYVTLDAAGRSANKAMADERVRKAFMMAVDRHKIVKNLIPGGDKMTAMPSICFKPLVACPETSNEPYAYDPEQAKKLLAEAGYANGFDLTLYMNVQIADIAEAIAGDLRRVGIRAGIEGLPTAVYVKRRGQGDFTAFVGTYPTTSQPDAANLLDFFFAGDRDYWHDALIEKAAADGSSELDIAKRAAIYAPAFNRVNEKAYIMPIIDMPVQWAHGKDVVIRDNPLSVMDATIGDFAWK